MNLRVLSWEVANFFLRGLMGRGSVVWFGVKSVFDADSLIAGELVVCCLVFSMDQFTFMYPEC